MQGAKFLRDKRRKEAFISEAERNEMTRQSQFLKAELQRKKKAYAEQITAAQTVVNSHQEQITAWKRERKMKSDRLQRWLSLNSHYSMHTENVRTYSISSVITI